MIRSVRAADFNINNLSPCLKPFASNSLTLTGYSDGQGRDIVEDGFCAAVVEYYAKWSKPRQPGGNVKAQQPLTLIQHLGMRVFIHQKTGWKANSGSPIPNDFEQEFATHKERLTVRQILKIEDHPELMSAVELLQQKHSGSRIIFAETNDALNKCLETGLSIAIALSLSHTPTTSNHQFTNWFEVMDSNWSLIVTNYPDMI